MGGRRGMILLCGLGAALLCGLLYLPGRPGAFHFDDYHSLVNNPSLAAATLHEIATDPSRFSGLGVPLYRPVTLYSFALQSRAHAPSPSALLTVNILLHAASVGLFFLLVFLFTRNPSQALITALIFGLNPLATQAVNYLSCRSILLATAFTLAGMAAALISRDKNKIAKFPLIAAGLFLFALGLLSKEEVFPAPVIFLIMIMTTRDPPVESLGVERQKKPGGLAPVAAGLFAVAGLFLVLRHFVGVSVLTPAHPARPLLANLATGLRVDSALFGFFCWPLSLSVVHDFTASTGIVDARAGAALIFLLAALVLTFRARASRPLWFLGSAWFILGLLPTTTLAPLRNPLAEHHAYFSMAGLALALGDLITPVIFATGGRKRLGLTAVSLVLVFWAALTVLRCREWRTEEALWKSAAAAAPRNSTVWVNLGVAQWESGDVARSKRAFERALRLDPKLPAVRANLGRIYVDEGRLEEGLQLLIAARQDAPLEPEINYNLARAYDRNGQYRLAETCYLTALRVLPSHFGSCEGLAALYAYRFRDPQTALAVIARCRTRWLTPDQAARIEKLQSALKEDRP